MRVLRHVSYSLTKELITENAERVEKVLGLIEEKGGWFLNRRGEIRHETTLEDEPKTHHCPLSAIGVCSFGLAPDYCWPVAMASDYSLFEGEACWRDALPDLRERLLRVCGLE